MEVSPSNRLIKQPIKLELTRSNSKCPLWALRIIEWPTEPRVEGYIVD
jgi:hypothetical protein